MSLADEITQIFEDATPVFSDAFHASSYRLFKVARTGAGSTWEEQEPEEVEVGRCELIVSGPGAGYQSGQLVIDAATSYQAELPRSTVATQDHLIEIDGMKFQILDVAHPDPWGMFVQVSLEMHR